MAVEHTAAKHVATALAEGVVMVLIAPVVFDLADRGILDPRRTTRRRAAFGLWAGLAAAAVASIALRHVATSTELHDVIDYGARAQEAWVAMLLVSVYLTVFRTAAGADGSTSYAPPARLTGPAPVLG